MKSSCLAAGDIVIGEEQSGLLGRCFYFQCI